MQELTYTVDQIANGSRGLLEEVATGKVTGEEEYWSRTDLWDFQANVDGARVGLRGRAARSWSRRTRSSPTDARHPLRRAADPARRAAGRRRLQVLRRADAGRGQGSSPTRSTRCPSRCRSSPRLCSPEFDAEQGLSQTLGSSAAARPPPGWPARSRSAARARARPASRRPVRRRTPSAASTRPASSPRPRTGCTSRRSTSPPRTATSWSTLLKEWTEAAERMTAGQAGRHRRPGRGSRNLAARRHRRGDRAAARRADHHLRLRAVAVPRRRRQGPLRPGRPAARGAAHAAALPGRQPRPGALVRRPVHPGLRRRPAGGGARDPQPGPDRLRHRRGPLVAARLRPDLDHLDQPVHAAEPVRLQGRHHERQGRGDRGPRGARLGGRRRRRRRRRGWPAAPTSSPAGST